MSYLDNSTDIAAFGQVAENGKDDNTGKNRGEGVEDADEQGVTVTIVIHIVIAGQHQLTAKPNRERKEGLGGGQGPDLKTERS